MPGEPQPDEMGGALWAKQAAARRLDSANEPEQGTPAPVAKKAAKKATKKAAKK